MAEILVVDEDEELVLFLKSFLESKGYSVKTASNMNETFMSFSEKLPDLILLDIMLPGVDGYEICKTIREKISITVPIIFLSARRSYVDQVKGFDVGGSDYLTKPVDNNLLIEKIQFLLKNPKNYPVKK